MPNLNPRTLFLVDHIGAIISAASLRILLPMWQEYIGLPFHILYYLAGVAGVFAVYSLICFITFPAYWRNLLRGIALANATYGLITMVLMYYHFSSLFPLGLTYFILEVLVLIVLVRIEWRTSKL